MTTAQMFGGLALPILSAGVVAAAAAEPASGFYLSFAAIAGAMVAADYGRAVPPTSRTPGGALLIATTVTVLYILLASGEADLPAVKAYLVVVGVTVAAGTLRLLAPAPDDSGVA